MRKELIVLRKCSDLVSANSVPAVKLTITEYDDEFQPRVKDGALLVLNAGNLKKTTQVEIYKKIKGQWSEEAENPANYLLVDHHENKGQHLKDEIELNLEKKEEWDWDREKHLGKYPKNKKRNTPKETVYYFK